MDAIGLRPRIEEMADRIASWGYIVLAPNTMYRSGTAAETTPRTDLRIPEERAAYGAVAAPYLAALDGPAMERDTPHYVAALRALDGVTDGPIGVTGYCMGGRLALNIAAARPDDVAAVGMFHTGGLVTEHTVKEQLLYEVHDPAAYLTPDVVADLSQAQVLPQGPDRVRLQGVRGHARTDTLKVNVCFESGWLAEGGVSSSRSRSGLAPVSRSSTSWRRSISWAVVIACSFVESSW